MMRPLKQVRADPDGAELGQMLLATGLVLLMSLLSMSVYGVKVAGLGTPHDPGNDAVIQTSRELSLAFTPLIENRTSDLMTAGVNTEDAVWLALNWTHDDLLHHGEVRGVEVKLLNPQVTNASGVYTVVVEVGLADRHARLSYTLTETLNLN